MSETRLSTIILVFAAIGVGTYLTGSAENIWRKAKLAGIGAVHMLLSKDKKFKPEVDSSQVRVDPSSRRKRIIFLRHGESEWNEVFNRGFGPSFLVRLLSAFVREVMMLSTRDSVFFDSPLSNTGIQQTQELIRFLQKAPDSFSGSEVAEAVSILRGGSSTTSSVVVTSNLRRAIATGLITLWERLRTGKERYLVHSALQEMTFNVDGISLLERGEVPDEALAKELGGNVVFDAEFNAGTKGLSNRGMKRMKALAEWAMQRPEDTVVCVGHSLYFRSFFRCFLPQKVVHDAKKKKIVNCGVVAFTLESGVFDGRPAYRIEPKSIVNVYGGFK
ncbi:unnamed protein product [Pylaiella littoralis]